MGAKVQIVEKFVTGMTKTEFILTASVLFIIFLAGLAICVWLLKQWNKPLEKVPEKLDEIKGMILPRSEIELMMDKKVSEHEKNCILKKLSIGLLLCCLLSSCASYKIMDGTGRIISQGEAEGFLRTITVVEKYDLATGQVVERKISTESTTKDVLMGLNEFIDTAADTFGRLKP